MLAREIIRRKRDGAALAEKEIGEFVRGVADESWSEGQVAALAMAMAICLRGTSRAETVALTLAIRNSGQRLLPRAG
ncbi:MAG: hypothetical protein KGM91_14750 [Burkholderiales bacterium]|nr:hypothetical protein [Burkholderiales bacterium]